MAYDSFRRVILFGPTVSPFTANRWEFWTWNGARWNQFEDYSIPLWGLQYGDLTFDDYRRRSVWFGGQVTRPNSTGFFDGQQWEMLTTSPTLPSGRYQQAMAYDASRHAVVMFGGETANFEFNGETWELIAVDQPLINEQPASQYRQAGTTASFTVTAVGAGALSYQWFRDGVRLSDDGRITGTATSTLTVADVWQADVGRYSALVLNDCGSTRSQMAVLTLDPKLQVFSAEKTLTLIWSDTAVILEQADSPAGPWVEVQGAGSPFHPSIFGPARFFRLRQTGP